MEHLHMYIALVFQKHVIMKTHGALAWFQWLPSVLASLQLKQCPRAIYFLARSNTSLGTGLLMWWALFFEMFNYLRCVEQLHKEPVRVASAEFQSHALCPGYLLQGDKWWERIKAFTLLLCPGQCWDIWDTGRWDEDLFLQPLFGELSPLRLFSQTLFTRRLQLNSYSSIAIWNRQISLKGRCCGVCFFLEEHFGGQHLATFAAATAAHLPLETVMRRAGCCCSLGWRLCKVGKSKRSLSDLALQILHLEHVSGLWLKQAKLHCTGPSAADILAVDYRVMQWVKQS